MVVAADGTPIYPDNPKAPTAQVQSPCAAASSSSCLSPPSSSDVCVGGGGAAPYSSLVLEYPQPRPSPPSSWSELPPPESHDKESNETAMDDGEVDVLQDFDAFEPDLRSVSVSEAQTESKKTHRRRRRRELETMGLPPSSFTVPGNKIRLPAAKGTSSRGSSAASVLTNRALKNHHRDGGPQQQPRAQKQHTHARRRDKMFKCPV